MSDSLTDIVAKLGEQVKALRKEGDLAALLAAARQAADEVERRIGEVNGSEEQRELMAVQRWTYNAAADCWPGWSLPSEPSDPRLLVAARELAQRSSDIVGRLNVGQQRQGTGIWLCGAFDLALGKYEDASRQFAVAHEYYVAADAPSGGTADGRLFSHCAGDRQRREFRGRLVSRSGLRPDYGRRLQGWRGNHRAIAHGVGGFHATRRA
jgi:hypothetical protein